PTLDLELPWRTPRPTRPLTDDEVELCRLYADCSSDRLPVVWALSESTARVSEIPAVRVIDVDLSNGLVFLPGTGKTVRRWAPMTEWAIAQLGRRLRNLGPGVDRESLLVPWRLETVARP